MATGGGGTIGAANIELGVDTSKLDAGMAAAKQSVQDQAKTIEASAAPGGGAMDQFRRDAAAELVALVGAELDGRKLLEEIINRTGQKQVDTLSEEERYQRRLFQLRKQQLTDEQSIANWKKQGVTAQKEATVAAQQTANAVEQIATEGEAVGGPNGFMKFFNGDLKEATKLFSTFGKLAIFKQVANDAYALGNAIGTIINNQLTGGKEAAQNFSDSLTMTAPAERAKAYQEELDKIAQQMALLQKMEDLKSDPFNLDAINVDERREAVRLMVVEGQSIEKLKQRQQELLPRLTENLKAANAMAQRQKEAAESERVEMLKNETMRAQIASTENESNKLDLQFRQRIGELNKRIVAENSDAARAQLEEQKQFLYAEYRNQQDAITKAQQEKEDAEIEASAEQKKRDDETYQNRLNNLREENEAARNALITDPRQKAEAEFQTRKRKLEQEIAAETDHATKVALNQKLDLLRQTHTQALANIDREAAEKQKADADVVRQQMQQMAEQFSQLRGEINSLFNAGNIEVGINRLGGLLEVLIQKTGDGR
jgi:hypothetical protein